MDRVIESVSGAEEGRKKTQRFVDASKIIPEVLVTPFGVYDTYTLHQIFHDIQFIPLHLAYVICKLVLLGSKLTLVIFLLPSLKLTAILHLKMDAWNTIRNPDLGPTAELFRASSSISGPSFQVRRSWSCWPASCP